MLIELTFALEYNELNLQALTRMRDNDFRFDSS